MKRMLLIFSRRQKTVRSWSRPISIPRKKSFCERTACWVVNSHGSLGEYSQDSMREGGGRGRRHRRVGTCILA